MRLVSWNVNGIRSAMDKGFREFIESDPPDMLCLQETKARPEQVDVDWADDLGYERVWNSAEKKGYSGTAIWSRISPEATHLGIGRKVHDGEGRVITATFDRFHLVTVYTPNAQRELARLDYRMRWDKAFLSYIKKLDESKPVIFCGDLNCAHQEIDLANPKSNRRNAGFTDEERSALDRIQAAGFMDSFRELYDEPNHYTWWTFRSNARERNIGWRLDYFWASKSIWDSVQDAKIRADVFGSDHCPVELLLKPEIEQ